MPGGARRADIQGLRALAVLLVVAFHAGPHVPGGFTGVDVFFAISGFVITGTLLRELAPAGRLRLPRFYARRIRRLLPALATMVVVVAALGVLLSPAVTQRTGAVTGVFTSLFAANFYLYHLPHGYFDIGAGPNPLLHTWTLAVEEQFYLVFPALLLLGWRLRARAGALAAIGVVSAVSLLLSLDLSGVGLGIFGGNERLAFYGSPARAWEFGVGALLALAVPLLARIPTLLAQLLAASGFVAILAGARLIQSTAHFPGRAALLPVLGACALLAAGTATSRGVVRLLAVRPAVWIGDLSYSWYLWHWPLIVFAMGLWPGSSTAKQLAAVVSILPAWLSYRYVENPIRMRLPLEWRRVVTVGAVCVIVPLLASLGLVGANRALAHTAALESWQRSQLLHADVTRNCDAGVFDAATVKRCTWAVPSPRGRVVLVGDSNAGQYTEVVAAAANRSGYDATVLTYPGCPFVDLVVRLPGDQGECPHVYRETMRALRRLRPSLVIAASRTDKYVTAYGAGDNAADEYGVGPPGGGTLTYHTAQRAQLWTSGLTRTLRSLGAAQIPAVVVHPIPLAEATPADCAVVRILLGSCRGAASRAADVAELRPIVALEDHAVAAAPSASAIGFTNELCGPSTCASARGSTFMYWDGSHLSIDGARTLMPEFVRVIHAHARPRPA